MQITLFSENISHELQFLLYSFILGSIITFLYDNFRILRRIVKHNTFLISMEDFLFWIMVTYSVFSLQYYANNGIFRWFCILGAFIGMSLYKMTIGRFYVNILTMFLQFLLKWVFKILSFILKPILRLEVRAGKTCSKTARKMGRILKFMKNRLTQKIKMIKITLCKHKKVP